MIYERVYQIIKHFVEDDQEAIGISTVIAAAVRDRIKIWFVRGVIVGALGIILILKWLS